MPQHRVAMRYSGPTLTMWYRVLRAPLRELFNHAQTILGEDNFFQSLQCEKVDLSS